MLRKEAHFAQRKMAVYAAALRRECALSAHFLYIGKGKGRAASLGAGSGKALRQIFAQNPPESQQIALMSPFPVV